MSNTRHGAVAARNASVASAESPIWDDEGRASRSPSHAGRHARRALAALMSVGLLALGCGGDDALSSEPEPTLEVPADAPSHDAEPADARGSMVEQWNRQKARVADCPAYENMPGVEQMARWGLEIVEFESDAEGASESEDMENPASPTGSTRFSRLRYDARILRSSGETGERRVLRYTERRLAEAPGVAMRADASDPLDGRPGRARIEAGKSMFAIVFPDPYHAGDLGVTATFRSEQELVGSLPGEAAIGSFESFASAIRAAREATPGPMNAAAAGEE